ncbi:hypothetical protein Verru16b_02039 [Lacunisphaera limnophila]|uniref:Glycosyltransferase RgtA/B/C/D-like domain-containing protein n=1 Tax=Lacunisphaera limnophila TaxID=1838286 RepID=A0A1D8AVP8_9BACT|nr:hypothetical protein [Lacunisphaera limnophila]AOS44970.1 hypothetical protein Verru16b_02039 [Lacunisphaera limnophila]
MIGTDHSRTSPRALAVMFGLVLLLALALLTRSWHASLLDRYEFRQLQTALSTWWIASAGWQLDYLFPLFGPPWSVPMEFPVYQIIVATLHQATGLPLEQAGRLTGIIFLLACLPALYDLLGFASLPPSRRLVVLAVVLSSPVYLFYARTFMIETTALCFSVWFLALLRRSLENPRALWILATTAAGVLAGLTKITTFLVFGLPALALVLNSLRQPTTAVRRNLVAAIIPAVVSLGLAWWWVRHGDAVKDSNPFTGFLAARELHHWNFGALGLRFDWSFWVHLQETVVDHNLAEGAIAIALLCAPFAPARTRWIAGVAVLGFLSGPLVFANLYHIHDYYYAANSLLLLAAAGLMLAAAWDDARLPRGTNWLALGLILLFQFHAYYRGYYSHHRNPAPPPPPLAALIRDAVPADGVVLIYGADWNPLLPYYFQRRAVMVPGERENETAVLDDIIAQLPPRRIAAMVIHGDKLRDRPDFIRERAARFGLSPAPAATHGDDALYLPAGTAPANLLDLAPVLTDDTFPAGLPANLLTGPALALFQPAPHAVHSQYGIGSAELDGRLILNAHAPAELVFRPAPGARRFQAVAGLPDAAFAPDGKAVTDGISLEVVAVPADGPRRLLYRRQLDPARQPADRGPQTIDLTLPAGFSGDLHLRLGNGPAGSPTNDWAYVAKVEIR